MSHKTQKLSLENIIVDESIQPRARGVNEEHVQQLVEAYTDGQDIPLPTVWTIGSKYKLAKGFNRIAAMKRCKFAEAEFIVRHGSEDECAIDALTSNKTHGLNRTAEDKRRCVQELLKLKPEWTNPKLAEAAGVSNSYVGGIRKEMEAIEAIPKLEEREGKDGRIRKSTQKKPLANVIPNHVAPPPTSAAKKPAAPVNRMAKPDDSEDSLEALLSRAEMWDESPLPVDEPSPQVEYTRKADVGEPPIDPRFMPNAGEAEAAVEQFKSWKAKLNSLKSEIAKAYPAGHVLANRIDVPAIVGELSGIVERLDSQWPEFPCPRCCGTGKSEEGDDCPVCDSYGITDRQHYGGNKSFWKKSMSRYVVLKNKANVDGAPTAEAGKTTRKGRKHHAGNQPSVGNTAEQKP